MRELDDRLIRWATAAYLWLLDWTGVYVATVGMFFVAMEVGLVALNRGEPRWYDAIYFVVMSLAWFSWRWLWQHLSMLSRFNTEVLNWRDSTPRHLLTLFNVGLIVFAAVHGQTLLVAGNVAFLIWVYVTCVTIRDREPKEFRWAALRPAMGGVR